MSTFNTLRLTRTLRQERDKIYTAESMDKLCKKYKVHEKNYIHFQNIAHTVQIWGESTPVFNTGYTFDLLDKISQNSLNDISSFYKISQKFHAKSYSDLQHNSYKKMLTIFFMSYEKAPVSINYSHEFTYQEKLEVVAKSLQYKGSIAKDFTYKNEDLILELIHSNYGFNNIKDQKLEIFVKSHDIKNLNTVELSEKINPLKANPYVISLYLKHHSDIFENISISVEKLKSSKTLCIESDLEFVGIRRFYDLINVFAWVINNEKKSNKDFSQIFYSSPQEIISTLDKSDNFIINNLRNCLNKHKKNSDFWLNLDLALQLEDKQIVKSKKI